MQESGEDYDENNDNIILPINFDEAKNKGKSCYGSTMNCLRTFIKGGYRFLKDPWNLIDVVNIIILFISFILWIVFISNHENKIDMGNSDYFKEGNNDDVVYTVDVLKHYRRTVSINLILISFKVLKYLGVLIERVTLIFKVISHAKSDIIYFFILYLIIFISFTTTFHIFYGAQVERFSTFENAFNTLFLYLGRNILEIDEMKKMSFNLIIFITSMEFILMNMFIAIIALSYSTVNKQMKEKKDDDKILEYKHLSVIIYYLYKRVTRRCCKRKKNANTFDKKDENEVQEDNKDIDLNEMSVQSFRPPKNKRIDNEISASQIKVSIDEEDSKVKDAISEESKKSKKAVKTTNYGSSNRLGMISQASNMNGVDSDEGEGEGDEEEKADAKQGEGRTEEEIERERQKLLEMNWNVKFSLKNSEEDFNFDEAVQSEMKANALQREREKKWGRKLWNLIGYIIFFTIYSVLVFSHVSVSMFNMYNDSLKNNIEGVTIKTFDDDYINITDIHTYSQLTLWLTDALDKVIDTEAGDVDNYFYFVNDYNFVLERRIRLCFRLAQQDLIQDGGGPKDPFWKRYTQNQYTIDTSTFVGETTGDTYTYNEDGYHNDGSHCKMYLISDLRSSMMGFVNDKIIGNKLFFLSIEMVTYEASNEFYTYSGIKIELNNNGEVQSSLDIASLDIHKYTKWYHWIRMIFELIFIFTIFYMIFAFIRRKYRILKAYNSWYFNTITHLTPSEKIQRFRYEPEIIRKAKVVVDFFTIFEFLFLVLSLVIFIKWLVFITKYQKLKQNYHDDNRNDMYNDFYNGKELFDNYKILLAITSICISFNLLSHVFFLNHCLADSKMEIIYFLLFYVILILGFVAVAHLQFGPLIYEYHTFGNAMVE